MQEKGILFAKMEIIKIKRQIYYKTNYQKVPKNKNKKQRRRKN